MSRAAIHYAILAQLAAENKAQRKLTENLGADPNNPQGSDKYTEGNVASFLANVALRLRADEPPLAFKWSAMDRKTCVSCNLATVVEHIAELTAPLKPNQPDSPDK